MSKKQISKEDRILWGKVARSVQALPGRLEALDEFEAAFGNIDSPKIKAAAPALQQTIPNVVKRPERAEPRKHHPIERPVKRKISKGRLPLEARIDLHGMVQSEAHALLHHFILDAHRRGLRHVLVITGKGASRGSDGALRRAVPLWFSKPEFRVLISGYEEAARNHGGEGALYVRLSRQKGLAP